MFNRKYTGQSSIAKIIATFHNIVIVLSPMMSLLYHYVLLISLKERYKTSNFLPTIFLTKKLKYYYELFYFYYILTKTII